MPIMFLHAFLSTLVFFFILHFMCGWLLSADTISSVLYVWHQQIAHLDRIYICVRGFTETHSNPVCSRGRGCSACALIHLPWYLSFRSNMKEVKENYSVACFIQRLLLALFYVSFVLFVWEGGSTHCNKEYSELHCYTNIISLIWSHTCSHSGMHIAFHLLSGVFKQLLLTILKETCFVTFISLPYLSTLSFLNREHDVWAVH